MAIGDFKGFIHLVWRFLAINTSNFNYSTKDKEYIFDNLGLALRISLMT